MKTRNAVASLVAACAIGLCNFAHAQDTNAGRNIAANCANCHGTNGVSHGIAIPHGKLRELDRLHGFFARMEQPVDFASIDDVPVDLIFVLLAPESAGADHLKALARVSRLLRDRTLCDKLRGTDNPDALYALLTESAASHAA